jgi:hypothetical protein
MHVGIFFFHTKRMGEGRGLEKKKEVKMQFVIKK